MRYRCQAIAIDTGLRQSNLCGLQWTWEAGVPEIARSVFVIPAEAFKTQAIPAHRLKVGHRTLQASGTFVKTA